MSNIQPYQGGTLLDPYSTKQGGAQGSRVSFAFWQKPVYQAADGTYYCPGFDGPTYCLDNPWDYLYLGIPSTQPYTPGLAKVTVKKYRDVDKKKAAGNDGARVTIHGIEPAMVTIDLRIWTPEQLRQFANIWPTLFPTAGKGSPPAYDVQHPELAFHGVKSLQFVELEGPEIDRDRVGTFKLHAVEFLKPGTKNVTATAVGALGSILDAGAIIPTPGSDPNNTGP